MKQRIDKIVPALLLIAILFFLVSCKGGVGGGENTHDTAALLKQVQTGTQGVEVGFVNNYPPNMIYDRDQLIVMLDIYNKGNYNLPAQDCFVQITGFDQNILGGELRTPRSCAENMGGVLDGKNVYNTFGGTNMLEFKSSINLPQDIFEYNPTLNVLACYMYHTNANPSICVDPLLYGVTSEQKTCIPHGFGMAGGQGAPVGLSYVGVQMSGGEAIVELEVANFGSGQVVSPYANLQYCGDASIDRMDKDKVHFNVQLSGGSLINCKPQDGIIRLTNNVPGKIVCRFNINGASAFETPLMVDLDYGYIQSWTKPLKIIKTPQ